VLGSAAEAFAFVREHFENRGWTYEEGDSSDPVANVQWFVDPDDELRNVGVWLSSPEELAENQQVEPDGDVPADTSVVLIYYWP